MATPRRPATRMGLIVITSPAHFGVRQLAAATLRVADPICGSKLPHSKGQQAAALRRTGAA